MADCVKLRKFMLDDVLRAVQQHCAAVDMAALLGCDVATVRRYLRRAELAELVTETHGVGVRVWELTDAGAERIRG